MRIATKVLPIFLSVALLTYAQGNTFDRVRYNGGTVASKVGPKAKTRARRRFSGLEIGVRNDFLVHNRYSKACKWDLLAQMTAR